MSTPSLASKEPGIRPFAAAVEVWGGAEYTCNRVSHHYFDQMELSGHASRASDLERIAGLGIRALRCGVLWERHVHDADWKWSDQYLSQVRAAGMSPIVGLVHHGSGPRTTSLLDPAFPEKLASYAGEVAARYPWVKTYTPVNEPHTTARFSCRYGLWFPHHLSEKSFLLAFLHQMKAVALSMEAIRKVRADARLLQTEDLGKTWATEEFSRMGDLLSERRWLPFDLLTGTVDRQHPLYGYIARSGIPEAEIMWFRDHPSPPDVLGVNYYVTSDRFLDHRLDRYPASLHSAEGPFADLEAVRVRREGIQGFGPILMEAHRRYHLPIAITEVHLGDQVDEQIRWAAEAWHAMQNAQRAGVDCKAFTFWALLGSYFWNVLVTRDNGHYEPGVFNVPAGTRRPGEPAQTALAEIVRQCARGEELSHPALRGSGWWQHSNRLEYNLEAELVA